MYKYCRITGGLGDCVVKISYLKRDTFLNALECVELEYTKLFIDTVYKKVKYASH